MRDLCYLHGFVIREGGDTNAERFEGVFAEDLSAGAECEAFAATMTIFRRYPAAAVVHYSKYERPEYRKLQRKYPEVATVEEIETLFALHRLSGLINGPRRAIRRCDDEEEGEDGKPQKTCGVQIALYTDILMRLVVSAGRYGYIWDVHALEKRYSLYEPLGPRSPSIWEIYLEARASVTRTLTGAGETRPASASVCKQCVWGSYCLKAL